MEQGEKVANRRRESGFVLYLFLVLALMLAACAGNKPTDEKTYHVVAEYEVFAKLFLPSNIMLLIDKSGSMADPVNPGKDVDGNDDTECTPGNCNSDSRSCKPVCSTRINELRYAMREFLNESLGEGFRPLGKFGLTLFPRDDSGNASNSVQFAFATSDEDAALRDGITDIQEHIFNKLYNSYENGWPVYAGTPTGASLKFLLDNVSELKDASRKNFILLLTDGLPNSNPGSDENDEELGYCQDSRQCVCTLSPIACSSSCSRNNCLDQNGTVSVIEELRKHGIKTIVVGFGEDAMDDVDGIAMKVLNAMAKAGGDVRKCGGKAQCTAYYPAADRAELLRALQEVSRELASNSCVFDLGTNKPASAELLVVDMDGKRVPPENNTYSYDRNSNTVVFVKGGILCNRLGNTSIGKSSHINILFLEEDP